MLAGFLATVLAAASAAGQTGTVNGSVVDAQLDRPLGGAVLNLTGTRWSAISTPEGRFTIGGVAPGTYSLRVSLIGYAPQEQTVIVRTGEAATVTFRLTVSAVTMEDLVVIGYGATRRRDLTGAVSPVRTEALERTPLPSVDQLLQGTAAGVQVTQASNAPGGGISVRVRGASSINGNAEPLYVVDGFPIENDIDAASPGNGGREGGIVPPNPLASLSPSDIESIQVLKDASATAIYGSRGANGVVIITTKNGTPGRTQMSLDVSSGVQSVSKRYDLLNSSELAQAINEARMNTGQAAIFADPASLGAGTDWQDAIFRSAPMRSFQGSISGGSTGTNYTSFALTGGLFDQEGVVIGSEFKRVSLRANVEQWIGKFRAGANVSGSRVNTRFIPTDGETNKRAGAVGAAIQAYPFLPVRFENGIYPYQVRDLNTVFGAGTPLAAGIASELPNPVSMALQTRDQYGDTRLLGNAFGEYELLTGLRAKVMVGGDYASRFRDTYYPRETRPGEEAQGNAIRGRVENSSFLNENTLAYDRLIGSGHSLSMLAGYTYQTSETVRNSQEGSVYVSDITGFDDIGAGSAIPEISSRRERWMLISWLGRATYSLMDRYTFTVTGRRDGSSRFGRGNKWGFFPSAAIAWRASEESFLRDVAALDELKLRGSYGVAGNPSIRPYQSLARLDDQGYSFGNQQVPGYFPISVANPDLTWESTKQFDIGVDLGLWGRATLTADYYNKRTDNLLLQIDLPAESGFSTALLNSGSVENRGFELSLNLDVLPNRGGLAWNTGFTFARNSNKVVDLPGESTEIFATTISDDFKLTGALIRLGEPVGVFYGYRSAGVVRDAADSAAYTVTRLGGGRHRIGDLKLVDADGDGDIDTNDRTVIGSPHPDFTVGWQNSLSMGPLSLSTLLQGSFGQEVLNLNLWRLEGGTPATNITRRRFENRWTPENPNSSYPRLGSSAVEAGTNYTDRLLENGSYLRLSSISLAYDVPVNWIRARGFSRARVYVTGMNLFTMTDYSGFDPEVSSLSIGNVNRGVDVGSYPLARSVVFGVNLNY
jgi:TonB-linked SusC/RagA family outer membrane protein